MAGSIDATVSVNGDGLELIQDVFSGSFSLVGDEVFRNEQLVPINWMDVDMGPVSATAFTAILINIGNYGVYVGNAGLHSTYPGVFLPPKGFCVLPWDPTGGAVLRVKGIEEGKVLVIVG